MEIIREYCGVEQWQVCGGPWGSTLALAYAQKFPERVNELILRWLFLGRKKEVDWAMQKGPWAVYPEYWEKFESLITYASQVMTRPRKLRHAGPGAHGNAPS